MNGYRKKPKGAIHYRHIGRYGEIASVLVKYGFGDILSRLNLERYFTAGRKIFRRKKTRQLRGISRWDRVRLSFEELGPTFIKLGQFASNRPDILPTELIDALEGLQDDVPPFDKEESVALIESQLKKPVEELFKTFQYVPFASASMAQVHKAELHDGTQVAVKVQRPDITDMITVDLEIMYRIAFLMQKHVQGMEVFNPVQLVDEFASAIRKELDFTTEALHFDHFRRNFEDDPTIYIPQVFHQLTTKRVITTEFINGIKITNIKELCRKGHDPQEIARRGAIIVLKQIFRHGFFHADPHPGNILIKDDNTICILDLGMTGILTPTSRGYLSSIIIGIANGDSKRIVRTLHEISDQQSRKGDELEYAMAELIQEYASRPLGEINVGEILNRLSQILRAYRLRLIPGFYLLVKALVTIEGIGYKLDPRFNMLEHLEPFAKDLIKEQFSPRSVLRQSADSAQDIFTFMRDLPNDARDIIALVKSGKVHLEFEHMGLNPFLKKIEQAANRLVFGIVLAALVMGSSIVVLSGIPPVVYGMPVIGLAGFVAAGLMGFWLLISILKHERM
ncbi:AarF/ABC1/UbiB kinase family protein [Chitinispirillales bacterium ANBcel5]|uniref:ABC1 kinase family protein n=1 Tax=Cellulosispirillum alkaliphilum TaxID=3039283 RepID=UPI002A541A1C|nr:AarF/ABC1/UbiB kinase family protein [Chitinispirillales bacterium ANBcel5]